MKKIKFDPIIKTYGQGRPVVVVVGCLHGDELVGKKIINSLSRFKIIKGSLITIIANPYALKNKKRFIDKDINRCFPGKKQGKVEERIAYQINRIIKKVDYVIDVHSTSTDTQDVIIIKCRNRNIKELLKVIKSKRVLLMTKGFGDKALVNFCSGVSFEYGRHNSPRTYQASLRDIKKVLIALGMIKGRRYKVKKVKTEYYKVYATEKKPKGFVMRKDLHNFKLFKKGQVLGRVKNKEVLAQEDFYPILFGARSYKDIMGFKAKKLKKIF